MSDRRKIAREATAAALRMRRSAGYGIGYAICVYDLAQRLGIEVRFLDLPSMEGMYYRASQPTIILSSLRPSGRRAFTCAHELGHHSRRDGTYLDQFVEQWHRPKFDRKEFAADCFAGVLLMPKMAVERAFAIRGWEPSACTPGQAFAISNYFGVGYTTLIHHMSNALLLLPAVNAEALLKVRPRQAQSLALGWEVSEPVWIVDAHWSDRAVDAETGDLIFVHGHPTLEGSCLERVLDTEGGRLLRARKSGIARLEAGATWATFVRVSRRGFVGRSLYRHMEEADNE